MTCRVVDDERMFDEAEGPEEETPHQYAQRIREMVVEAGRELNLDFNRSIMNTALDLYAVALEGLFGERWREFAHPENGDILRRYIEDSTGWETRAFG